MNMRKLLSFVLLPAFSITALAQSPQTPAESTAPAPAVPDSIKAELNIIYGHTPEQELKMDVYRPKTGGDKLPACVLVHGGGWVAGDKERFSPLAIGLAQRGYFVANIEYRLGPVAKYPAALEDCNLAVPYVRANAQRFGAAPNPLGASAAPAPVRLAPP